MMTKTLWELQRKPPKNIVTSPATSTLAGWRHEGIRIYNSKKTLRAEIQHTRCKLLISSNSQKAKLEFTMEYRDEFWKRFSNQDCREGHRHISSGSKIYKFSGQAWWRLCHGLDLHGTDAPILFMMQLMMVADRNILSDNYIRRNFIIQ